MILMFQIYNPSMDSFFDSGVRFLNLSRIMVVIKGSKNVQIISEIFCESIIVFVSSTSRSALFLLLII